MVPEPFSSLELQLNSFGFSPDDLGLENLDQTQASAHASARHTLPPQSFTADAPTVPVADTSTNQEAGHKHTLTHLDEKGMAHMVDVGQVTLYSHM